MIIVIKFILFFVQIITNKSKTFAILVLDLLFFSLRGIFINTVASIKSTDSSTNCWSNSFNHRPGVQKSELVPKFFIWIKFEILNF